MKTNFKSIQVAKIEREVLRKRKKNINFKRELNGNGFCHTICKSA